jgi:hypothetical protein
LPLPPLEHTSPSPLVVFNAQPLLLVAHFF